MRVAHLAGEEDRRQQHGGDDGHGVGLEQVGGHAGAVADVVADVVGDHGGVAGIVLGDAGLDLAHEVGADIGTLGEDAAAKTGEDGDQRAAEAERDHRLQHAAQFVVAGAGHAAAQDEVVAGDAEQAEADHQHAGDGAGPEGEIQAGGEALLGGLRGADVGAHRDVHADIAGSRRQHRADDEADGDMDAEGQAKDDQDHHADDADRGILAVEVGAGALLDGGGNLLHARGAGVGRQHLLAGDQAVDQRQQTADDDHVWGQLHPGLSSYGIIVSRTGQPRRRAGHRPVSVGAAVCQIGEQVANVRSSTIGGRIARLAPAAGVGQTKRTLRL